MLAVLETHPVQYHAPLYACLQGELGVPLHVVYGSDFSVSGSRDPQFGVSIAWDSDLLSGYESEFLSRVASGGPTQSADVDGSGLWPTLKRLKPDGVLILGYGQKFNRQAIVAALRLGTPILFRGEVNDNSRRRGALKRLARYMSLKSFYSRVNACLYIGAEARDHFIRHGVAEERLFFSPYATDDRPHRALLRENGSNSLRLDDRERWGIPRDRIVIMYCGKLYREKGPGVLVEALRALPADVLRSLHLLVVGDGVMKAQLQQDCETIVPRIDATFVGFQNQSRLAQFYRMADMLALPSFSETWGLVINEALLFGLPVVVTDRVGCLKDLVRPGKTGEFCPAEDPLALAAAIRRCLTLVRRADVAGECAALADEYSVRRAAQGVSDAYQYATKDTAPHACK